MTYVYGAVAVLSVLLLIAYTLWEKKKERNFQFLTGCVAAVNIGYFLLATAPTLRWALVANGISYFGAAYSVLAMLFIIGDVCQMKKRSWLHKLLTGISTAAFLLAASGDFMGLYYKSVQIAQWDGMTHLVKEYGPLHILYTVYLLSYVVLMLVIIGYAWKKQHLTSPKYTMLLMMAVLLNIGVWAVEQAVDIDFEFLSVSYIVTEVTLMLLYSLLRDYGIAQPGGQIVSVQMLTQLNTRQVNSGALPPGMEDMFNSFSEDIEWAKSEAFYKSHSEVEELNGFATASLIYNDDTSIWYAWKELDGGVLMMYAEVEGEVYDINTLLSSVEIAVN
jgi:hypothetical protein